LYRSWDEHEILELFRSDEETCLVAEDDGKIVGFALGCMMEKPRSAWRYGWLEWPTSWRSCAKPVSARKPGTCICREIWTSIPKASDAGTDTGVTRFIDGDVGAGRPDDPAPAGQFLASAQSRTFCSNLKGSNGFSKNLSS
jgi:hypothetical protein